MLSKSVASHHKHPKFIPHTMAEAERQSAMENRSAVAAAALLLMAAHPFPQQLVVSLNGLIYAAGDLSAQRSQ